MNTVISIRIANQLGTNGAAAGVPLDKVVGTLGPKSAARIKRFYDAQIARG